MVAALQVQRRERAISTEVDNTWKAATDGRRGPQAPYSGDRARAARGRRMPRADLRREMVEVRERLAAEKSKGGGGEGPSGAPASRAQVPGAARGRERFMRAPPAAHGTGDYVRELRNSAIDIERAEDLDFPMRQTDRLMHYSWGGGWGAGGEGTIRMID